MNPLSWLTHVGERGPLLATAVLLAKVTFLLAVAWSAHHLLRMVNPRWSVLLWRLTGISMMVVVGLAMTPPLVSWAVLPAADEESSTTSRLKLPMSASSGSQAHTASPSDGPPDADLAGPSDPDERSRDQRHWSLDESFGESPVIVRNGADLAAELVTPSDPRALHRDTAAIPSAAETATVLENRRIG